MYLNAILVLDVLPLSRNLVKKLFRVISVNHFARFGMKAKKAFNNYYFFDLTKLTDATIHHQSGLIFLFGEKLNSANVKLKHY